jgi:hypothetical protein
MADNTKLPREEDLVSVGTRISWGAVLAGAVVALALYLVLTMLGGAIGLSVGGSARGETLLGGALIWSILATAAALFAGGWVTSQLTAGETKVEAMVHGVILWGTVVAMMLWLTASGIQAGFNAVLGAAYAGGVGRDVREGNWEETARNLGFTQEQIDQAKKARERLKEESKDPDTQAQARRTAAAVTWGALFGTLLSMGAAIGGALLGAGPTRRLLLMRTPAVRAPSRQEVTTHV